jgi:hypothetical protein
MGFLGKSMKGNGMTSVNPDPHSIGNCDHFGPPDFAALVESHLQNKGIAIPDWEGRRFSWGGQLTESKYFKGLFMELLRRDGDWVVTALERSKTPLEEARLGLKEL